MTPLVRFVVLICFVLSACERSPAPSGASSSSATQANNPERTSHTTQALPTHPPANQDLAAPRALSIAEFASLVTTGSEAGEYFFSDNLISNETSYLQPAASLAKWVSPGQAYLGVGPEQNFSYIALTRPRLAFIVDIRRDNLLQHLLYKALFELAESRAHFLCLLLGRPWSREADPGESASVEKVLEYVTSVVPSPVVQQHGTDEVMRRIASYHLELPERELRRIREIHAAFHRGQLTLRFALHQPTSHRYPTLRELLAQSDPSERFGGFLAREESFRFVQRMHLNHRIVPIVGDFAGGHALSAVAGELRKRQLTVGLFYVSNVEQYLFEGQSW